MGKALFIAEKPSVARQFAETLKIGEKPHKGYIESRDYIVTWCLGHLVTMSYPDVYDEKYKKWSLETLPFLPEEFKYEIIPSSREQYNIVSALLNREDVETIYVCTDSGREGEYIYRLVSMMSKVQGKKEKRVWIDSQTQEEILRGIREAKDLSQYDNLAKAAFLRAKEDYLMGINFSRALSVKFAYNLCGRLGIKYKGISVGRVMTCVLYMIVRREMEIRSFQKTTFYRVLAEHPLQDGIFTSEWKTTEKSKYAGSSLIYKENGFLKKRDAEDFIEFLQAADDKSMEVKSIQKKKEVKNPPLLFNLAELQNECSKRFKISPDETLNTVQDLYEKRLVTYPRTDARVLSTAVAKEISKNISGLRAYERFSAVVSDIMEAKAYTDIGKSKYTNDSLITDHYAIIPTGANVKAVESLTPLHREIYDLIICRFLSIFLEPAVYKKVSLELLKEEELFSASFRALEREGYLRIYGLGGQDKKEAAVDFSEISGLSKGDRISVKGYEIKEGETSPPKRYTSGSIILAMENAGQLIEDEELRATIKGSGIGTSATRAEILKKLINITYINLNKKTQVLTPTVLGEEVCRIVAGSVRQLLNPNLTASWEKGLSLVAEGKVTEEEYMAKLTKFVGENVNKIKESK